MGVVVALLIGVFASGCIHQAGPAVGEMERFEYHQLCMGVETRLVVYAGSKEVAEEGCRAAFERVAELEDVLSDYRPDSELMRLCGKAGGPGVVVSEDLYRVLLAGQGVARRSGGAFDMTVGPMVQVWRKARKTHQFPKTEELERAKGVVGYEKIVLGEGRSVRLTTEGMRLDMGGIGKGFAGDEAIKVLKERGIGSALFQAGGDIVVSGRPPGKRGWVVEVPVGEGAEDREVVVENAGVSTSGDTSQYVEFGGVRYSHIVNPHTGLGLTNRVMVTVIGPNGLTSDPISKAASILSEKELREFLKGYPGVRVYVRRELYQTLPKSTG